MNFAPCGSTSPLSPTMCDYRYTSTKPNDLTLIWSASNGLIGSQCINGSWSAPYVVGSNGINPNLEYTFSASDADRMAAFTGATGPPYPIGTVAIPSPQPPSKTILLSPLNSSAGISLTPTLSWNCVMGASTYNLHLNDDAGFIRDYTGISQTSLQVSGLNSSTSYHWRVQAANPTGVGVWSDALVFTTH